MTPEQTSEALSRVLSRMFSPGEVHSLTRLTGGATKSTWSFDWVGAQARKPLIMQQTLEIEQAPFSAARRPIKLTANQDAAIMLAAREAGVPAPKVLHVFRPEDGLGSGYITERVEGETLGRRIASGSAFAAVRSVLATQCGEILAAIHQIPTVRSPFLVRLSPSDELAIYGGLLKQFDFSHAALSYAIRWIGERLPVDDGGSVVHADFRTGNIVVHPDDGIRCVLDWEIARLGDPMHDLGVLCMRSWRFGGTGACGGFGSRDDLYTAYERASGRSVDPKRVLFWEAMSNLKWAVACVRRGLGGGADGRALNSERTAIGRRLEEPLWDFITLASARS
jgi:aminoglycoside phosphotransferase (APT) family kinase protein